ncbi:subunit common to RNA polymerases I [Glugoides intestinalis]
MEGEEEIEILQIQKDITAPHKPRETLDRMTIYEKAYIIGVRAAQLSDDAPPFVDIGDMTDCIQIAKKELAEKKLPFIIRRKLPDGSFEDWSVDELRIPGVDF